MDVDARMDRAIRGVERHFGRPVSIVTVDGDEVSVDANTVIGDVQALDNPGVTTTENYLDCREQTLEDEGYDPAEGDVVTFSVRGTARTYEVVEVRPVEHGSVRLMLGRRSA
ncbi:MAG: hypothetical protein IT385_08160 [Deltaproteobacteria bacterium]|nr:hypothetical protein [Deltaproteobacteria bacterium]